MSVWTTVPLGHPNRMNVFSQIERTLLMSLSPEAFVSGGVYVLAPMRRTSWSHLGNLAQPHLEDFREAWTTVAAETKPNRAAGGGYLSCTTRVRG